jgi:DNA-binding NtrC family response regulator
VAVQRFRLVVVEGPGGPQQVQSTGAACSVGSHPSNDLILNDSTVSRFHCEVRVGPLGATVKDLGSRNGTSVDGVGVVEGFLRDGSTLRLGGCTVRFELESGQLHIDASTATTFGSLVGVSLPMRVTFAQLERAAKSDITVLLEGETGTGKEGAAKAVHDGSRRRDGPFVVIDCSALPANLLESELFGHERGAFTGAETTRIGAFEEADGGTVFLDEVGELPADLQPKLLRVLESKEVRRLGSNALKRTDVRVLAATNRDLRVEVNAGRFRPDLYFRLNVLHVQLPSLRRRPDDLPVLAEHFLAASGASDEVRRQICTPAFFANLNAFAWPGNVRELRNYLERCLLFEAPLPVGGPRAVGAEPAQAELARSFSVAKQHAIERFEQRYVEALLAAHGGKVAQAAAAANMDKAYLYRLIRRYQLKS